MPARLRAATLFARIALIALLLAPLIPRPATAQALIRDAEVERALKQLAMPLLQAAGLNAFRFRVYAIADDTPNAFVIDNDRVFVHSGMILRMRTPQMLQSVLAHEIAHIARGHPATRRTNLRNAATAARLGALLAVASGAAIGSTELAAGGAVGSASVAQRHFLAHSRAEESAADRTGLSLMAAAGIDPAAMLQVMAMFDSTESATLARANVYTRSHPVWRDRLREMERLAKGRRIRPDPQAEAEAAYWFARLKAKLTGFLLRPDFVLRTTTGSDEFALIARAAAYHRLPDRAAALAAADRLIALRPDDPYYHELKGQFLLENGQPQAAAAAYARAAELAPGEALILAGLGRAQLALGDRTSLQQARKTLERARARDPHDPRMLADLARVYARLGERGMAAVVTAERYALLGRLEDARINAERAIALLPRGSIGALRAADVVAVAEAALPRRQRGRPRR